MHVSLQSTEVDRGIPSTRRVQSARKRVTTSFHFEFIPSDAIHHSDEIRAARTIDNAIAFNQVCYFNIITDLFGRTGFYIFLYISRPLLGGYFAENRISEI